MNQNQRNRRFLKQLLWATSGVAVLASGAWLAGFRWNETESLPPGLWRVSGTASDVQRWRVAYFCPPNTRQLNQAKERGYLREGECPGDLEALFKPIVAIPGDQVRVSATGIEVNGLKIYNSEALDEDGAMRPLVKTEEGTYTVQAGQVWAISSYSPLSFDSRYFGPIELASIEGVAVPIWTSGELP